MYRIGDWYEDSNGRIFERIFDLKMKRRRWMEIDVDICGPPVGREVQKPLVVI